MAALCTVAPVEADFCSVSLEPGLKRKRLHSWVQQDSPTKVRFRAARATDKIELHKGLQACLSKKKIHSGFEQSSTMLQICYNSPMWHIRTPTPLGFCGQLHQEASKSFSMPHGGGFSVNPDLGGKTFSYKQKKS